MAIDFGKAFVINGNEGILDAPAIVASADALTSLITARGSINLSLGRLPLIEDISVRPNDPLVPYDAFVVSGLGSVVSGVTGHTSLNIGDYLMLAVDGDSTIAANWAGVSNVVIPSGTNGAPPYWGTNYNYVRVANSRLPFFPVIAATMLASASLVALLAQEVFGKVGGIV